MDVWVLALLFMAALAAGMLDAIAGGGALLTIPVLLLSGLHPVAAIATSKLQSSCANLTSLLAFARHGLIDWREAVLIAPVAFVVSTLGALSVTHVPRNILIAAVPVVLIGVAGYFAFGHRPREGERRQRLSLPVFVAVVIVPLAFYDGIFGPGTGMFLMIAFVTLIGHHLTEANALTKLSNASSNVGALISFAATGNVVWHVGLVMAVGAIIGGQLGSHLAVRHGAKVIRPVVVVFCCALAIKLLLDPTNPLRQAVTAVVGGWR